MTLHDREEQVLFHTYKRLPVEIHHGEGAYLFTADGRKYLDMFAGLAVNALGYAHPAVVRAITEQAGRYTHLSNYFLQEPQIRLAEILTHAADYDRVFFSNSGTEAVEGMMKLVRKWGVAHNKKTIVAMSNSFHGRTLGALSLMDRPKYREGFGPFLDNCAAATFNDSASLTAAVNAGTAAVVLEFIQGEGGIRPVTTDFVKTIEDLRRTFGFLLVADEIQAGIGRTGKFFSFQHFGVHPDIVLVAKPIGGGLPLGGILAGDELAALLEPGTHGTTFGGNPVACAAGVAVLHEILDQKLMDHAHEMGALLMKGLRTLAQQHTGLIREVRGYGLMVGAELSRDAEPVVTAMRDHGVLINGTDQTVLRFLPPLIVSADQVQTTLSVLGEVLKGA